MTEQEPSQDKRTTYAQPIVWLAAFVVILVIVLFNLKKQAEPKPEPVEVVVVKPEPVKPPEPTKSPARKPEPKPKPKKIVKKSVPPPRFDGFIIEGDLSTGGEPWSINNIVIKLLWIKNKGEEFKLGREAAWIQATETGLRYQLRLKTQPQKFTNWNNGVEGNIARIIAYLDLERDGRLSINNDKIIAISKELVRYRTGRFDTESLNEIQQQNIRKEGKGYVIIKQVQVDDGKSDWQVAHRESPAPVNLFAAETRLPDLYTKLIKMQEK